MQIAVVHGGQTIRGKSKITPTSKVAMKNLKASMAFPLPYPLLSIEVPSHAHVGVAGDDRFFCRACGDSTVVARHSHRLPPIAGCAPLHCSTLATVAPADFERQVTDVALASSSPLHLSRYTPWRQSATKKSLADEFAEKSTKRTQAYVHSQLRI